ncbi:MAG: hypothetical protein CFE37_13880 [Alphaproteobacteria bacterium PA4]|nr:MAG: hypothetical protein CFE37_13880 [Alphaproteobacteria bacterium PA4]
MAAPFVMLPQGHCDTAAGRYHGAMQRFRHLPPKFIAVPLAILLMAAAPVATAPPDFETQFASAVTLYDAGKAAEALPILDALLAGADTPADKGRIQQLRFFVLARLERVPEAREAIEVAVANNPEPPPPILAAQFKIRAFMGDFGPATDTLLLLAVTDPKALDTLPTELVNSVIRAARDDQTRAFNIDYALNTAGWSPPDMTIGDSDWLRLRLVAALVKQDRIDDARPVLDAIRNPVALVRLGIDRRYAALWPTIEQRLGPGADTADAVFVAETKARFDAAPKSLIARMGYADALNVASREAEAQKLTDVAKTPAELAALGDRESWLVNLDAGLLADLGQVDAALARLAALAATPVNGRTGVLAAMVNRPLLALGFNRADAAQAAIADAIAQGAGQTGYGQLMLTQARACALAQQGKMAEAITAAAPLTPAAGKIDAEQEDAWREALTCLGRGNDVAKILIRRLGDPETRTEMLFELQPFLLADRPGTRDAKSKALLRTLKARPDVKAAYLAAGRDLPTAVAPPR